MVTIVADCNLISRVDSYFTNMNMPWDKKKLEKNEVAMSVGLLEVWQKNSSGDYSYDRLWAKNFKS